MKKPPYPVAVGRLERGEACLENHGKGRLCRELVELQVLGAELLHELIPATLSKELFIRTNLWRWRINVDIFCGSFFVHSFGSVCGGWTGMTI